MNPELEGVIQTFEMAFRMQTAAPEILDIKNESAAVQALAGRGHAEGPPLREALRLYERKGDIVQAARVRDRLVASPAV